MSDTEQVFALYVQVNPVPEPALLPATRDESPLPTIEGSRFMDTREMVDTRERTGFRPPERIRRFNPAAVLAAAFVVVLAVVGGVLLLTGDGDTELVAAADARPRITWDGESCTYDGPAQISEGSVEFTLVNNGPREVTLTIWEMRSLTYSPDDVAAELERLPVGEDVALAPSDPVPDARLTLNFGVVPGQTNTASASVTAGTLLIDVITTTDGANDHVWRPATIEVLEP